MKKPVQKQPKKKVSATQKQHMELAVISPMTENQRKIENYFDDNKHLIIVGTAGTGKTFYSTYLALEEVSDEDSDYDKIVFVRSAVQTRDIGFLKGSLEEKNEVYELPYKQIINDLFGRGDAYKLLKDGKAIEFINTSFIRGLTLDNCIVILDEVQNCSDAEINTVVTRMGKNAKLIICGDTAQKDLQGGNKEINNSGIDTLLKVASRIRDFAIVHMSPDDILRGDIVKKWILEREKLGII